MRYDFYGVYTSCRDAAWRCQADFSVHTLPVKLLPIARSAGIRVVKNSDVNELKPHESGAGLFINGSWIIVYDDRLKNDEARMVIAHELGHIFLGHEYKYSRDRFASKKDTVKSENEADLFAIRLLAPACVLHELKLSSPKHIAELCEIPLAEAQKRAQRLSKLEKRNCFYKSELEAKVAEGFKAFVADNSNYKGTTSED